MYRNKCLEGFGSIVTYPREAKCNADVIDCISCVEGKQTRKTFPESSQPRDKSVGEKLHTDIGEPGTTSLGGKRYYIIFKDEYSTSRSG